MASLRKRPRSPFWWLKWRNPSTGKIEQFSTGHRYGLARETDRARQLQAEHTLKELSKPQARDETRWEKWVVPFLEHRYGQNRKSLIRCAGSWKRLAAYLREKEAFFPRQLRRAHAQDYMAWRQRRGHVNSTSGRSICRNSVLLELKVLSVLVNECVAREWLEYNPCQRLGLRKDPPRAKREMSDGHLAIIRAEIARRAAAAKTAAQKAMAHFYRVSFEIALGQTWRMSETCFPLADVDFDNCEITVNLKGNQRETKPLNPALLPLLRELQATGRSTTYDAPKMPSLLWFKFFDGLRRRHPDMANISFHSTRVTGISRAERAGVPEAVMMHLANHASTTVHRFYRKVKRSELAPVWQAMASLVAAGPSADRRRAPESPGAPSAIPGPSVSRSSWRR